MRERWRKKNKQEAVGALKTLGKLGASLIPGVDMLSKGLEVYDNIADIKDAATAMLSLGKSISNAELKNPKGSEFPGNMKSAGIEFEFA